MTNADRNELDVELNGTVYPLKLNWNSMQQIENALPRSVVSILVTGDNPHFSEYRIIIRFAAFEVNSEVDLDKLDDDIQQEGVLSVFQQTYPFISKAWNGKPKAKQSAKTTKKTVEKKVA